MKGVPIPISFAVMLAAIVALGIFFGAWAVSANAEERGRSLSFRSIAGGGANLDSGPFNPSLPGGQRPPPTQEVGESKADTWWGKTLLTACPLH
jgi:hypothetical protein